MILLPLRLCVIKYVLCKLSSIDRQQSDVANTLLKHADILSRDVTCCCLFHSRIMHCVSSILFDTLSINNSCAIPTPEAYLCLFFSRGPFQGNSIPSEPGFQLPFNFQYAMFSSVAFYFSLTKDIGVDTARLRSFLLSWICFSSDG